MCPSVSLGFVGLTSAYVVKFHLIRPRSVPFRSRPRSPKSCTKTHDLRTTHRNVRRPGQTGLERNSSGPYGVVWCVALLFDLSMLLSLSPLAVRRTKSGSGFKFVFVEFACTPHPANRIGSECLRSIVLFVRSPAGGSGVEH